MPTCKVGGGLFVTRTKNIFDDGHIWKSQFAISSSESCCCQTKASAMGWDDSDQPAHQSTQVGMRQNKLNPRKHKI